MADKPAEPSEAKRNKNAWILLGALVAFVLFAVFVPLVDNPNEPAFKRTLWDMMIGNMGTQMIHR